MSPDRDALVVTARLRVSVTDPRGREAGVVLSDRDGTLVLAVTRLPVVVAALPVPLGSVAGVVRRARTLLGAPGHPAPAWDQPVDVEVDGRLLLRRRDGRWRPASRAAAPVVGAAAGLLAVVAAVVAAAVVLLRRARLR